MVPPRTTAVFLTDITPPVVAAAASFVRGDSNVGWYTVQYSCSDADPDTTVMAEINGYPVADGQQVRLITHPSRDEAIQKQDRLDIYGSNFLLTVTCTDSSGNTTIVETVPAPVGPELT